MDYTDLCCRETTCCFTGHRNRDLPAQGSDGMKRLKSMLQLAIEETVNEGYDTFISGMAEGTDLICASIVCDLIASKHPDLKLICAIPYEKQGMRELKSQLDRYKYSLIMENCCQKVCNLSKDYYVGCYRDRNQFMVDHSSKIIGVYKYKAKGSGTLQTLNMAKKAGLRGRVISLDKNSPLFVEDDLLASAIPQQLSLFNDLPI